MKNKQLSIILPIHNEKESLEIMVRLLISSLKFTHEILLVCDSKNDNSLPVAKILKNEFKNVKIIFNAKGKSGGVMNAVDTGVISSSYNKILILAVDEIFPIIAIDKMIELIIKKNFDFVSGTRYSKGGIRLGGSFLGSILSRSANKFFQILTKIPLADCTTGIKMMKKNVWQSTKLSQSSSGWAFAFELSIKTWLNGYKITDYPIKSVDRLFGGSSSFRLASWTKEYSKNFIWGFNQSRIKKKGKNKIAINH
jgi:dolichol-phosphate mannosyltransferase